MLRFILLFVFFISRDFYGQSMLAYFKKLPPECTPYLNKQERKILLKNGAYTIPSGNSTDTEQYTLDTTTVEDYLRYEYAFTTGQRAFFVFELRKFTKKNGKSFLVYSKYGGLPASYMRYELRILQLGKKNQLTENYPQNLLPEEIPLTEFLKKETPDSLRSKIEQAVNRCYDLDGEKNKIAYGIYTQYDTEQIAPWLTGTLFIFKWNGESFDSVLTSE